MPTKTPEGRKKSLLKDQWWFQTEFESLDGWAQVTNGSGSIDLADNNVTLSTGSTSGSSARLNKTMNQTVYPLTWEKDASMIWGLDLADPTGILSVARGSVFEDDYTFQHIGFRTQDGGNTGLLGTVADGSNESTVVLESSLSDFAKRRCEVKFYSGEKAVFYVDGIEKGEITTNLPTGTNRAQQFDLLSENDSGSDRRLSCAQMRVIQNR